MQVWFWGHQVKKGKCPAACCPDGIPNIAWTYWDVENPYTELFPEYFEGN